MELLRYVLPHLLAGGIAGVVAAVVLVGTNPTLQGLVFHTDGGWLGFGLLTGGFVLTFAQAAAANAIMMIGQDDEFQ